MCGITGFIGQSENQKDILESMSNAIIHRGPNSSGEYFDDEASLGFRRLSIIDLEHGNQPLYNEDETKIIIFNGEIYNFQELREDLLAKGHEFSTHADTEVILHGYEEYGVAILNKLRGMFAFVIWDKVKKELFGARDFFGIKPFYYTQFEDTFVFSSEIKSILRHPGVKKSLNKNSLKPYMTFQYPATDETFFEGIYRIPEGHYFTYSKTNGFHLEKYWDVAFTETKKDLPAVIDEIDDVVQMSVKRHSIAEVPTGSFLSSGVDSSYVTALLKPEHTFSVGFGEGYNETDEAKLLAEKMKLSNTSAIVSPDEAFEKFPLIQYHLDEPDSNPSCVPLYFLSKLASESVTVVLSGEGADELFAGYQEYGLKSKSRVIKVAGEVLNKLPKAIKYPTSNLIKKMPQFPGKAHLYRKSAPAETSFIGHARVFSEEEADKLLKADYKNAQTPQEIVASKYKNIKDASDVKKMQYLDLHQWMPKDILLKADKLSMAHSIELRVPYLDVDVMNVASTVPTKYLLNRKNTKYAFRKAANHHLPDEWAEREKLGFPVPIRQWLQHEKYYNIVKELFEMDFVSEFFDQAALLQMLEDNYSGTGDYRRKIWTVYTFFTWYKVFFIDEDYPEVPVRDNFA